MPKARSVSKAACGPSLPFLSDLPFGGGGLRGKRRRERFDGGLGQCA